MSIITPVPAGQSVVIDSTSQGHHDHNDRNDNDHNRGVSVKDLVSSTAVAEATGTAKLNDTVKDAKYDLAIGTAKLNDTVKDARFDLSIGSAKLNDTVKDTRYDLNNSISEAKAATAVAAHHTDDRVSDKIAHSDERMSDKIAHTNQYLDSKVDGVRGAIGHSDEENQENFAAVMLAQSQTESRTLLEFAKNAAAAQLQVALTTSALQVQADKNAAALSVQALTFANTAALQLQTVSAANALEMSKYAAASQLLAVQIQAKAELDAEKCCCAMKCLIKDDGEKTRDLISANTLMETRDRALRAESVVAALFARNAAPVTPLT